MDVDPGTVIRFGIHASKNLRSPLSAVAVVAVVAVVAPLLAWPSLARKAAMPG